MCSFNGIALKPQLINDPDIPSIEDFQVLFIQRISVAISKIYYVIVIRHIIWIQMHPEI